VKEPTLPSAPPAAQTDLHAVLESVSDGVYAVDAAWRITTFNAAAERFVGRPRQELLGRTLWEVFPQTVGTSFERCFRHVMHERRPVVLEAHSVVHPDRLVEIRAAPMHDGGIAVVFTDVTERKKYESQLHASERQFRLIAENTLALIWLADADGRLRYANPRFRELFGGDGEDLLAGCKHALHPADRRRFAHEVLTRVRRREPFRGEFRIATPNGELRWLRCEGSPQRDGNGLFCGYVGVCTDITEAKAYETALLRTTRRLDAILANASMAIFLLDAEQRCVFMNPAAETLTGFTFAELEGRLLHETVHRHGNGLSHAAGECPIVSAFPGRDRVAGEEVFVHKDGTHYPVAYTSSPILGERGDVLGTVIEVRGTAAEEERARVLQETVERLQLVLRATQDAVWDWDVAGERIVWNESLRTAFGHDPASATRDYGWWLEQVHPDDRERVHASLAAVTARGNATHWSAEYRFRRADGSYADVLDRGYVLRADCGRVTRMIGAMLDLSARKQAERALEESRTYLRSVLDSTEEGFFAVDRDGRITLCNTAFRRLLALPTGEHAVGRPQHEVLGHTKPDGSPCPEHTCAIARCAREGVVAHVIGERFHAADGRSFPVEYRVNPIEMGGELHGAICTFTDITDRLRAEAALRESEARFRNMADHAPVMMRVTGPDGRSVYLNRRWYEFTGQTPEGTVGFGWLDAVHDDDRPTAERAFLAAHAARAPYRTEFRLRRADGSYRWVLDTAAPRFNECGGFLGHIGSVIDIDERREIEMRLRHSEARLRLATSAAAIGTWDYNLVTGEILWDTQSRVLFGLHSEETVTYETFLRCLHPEDRGRVDAAVNRVVSRTHPDEFESEFRVIGLDDGTERWVLSKGRALLEGEGEHRRPVRFLGVVMDITDLKRAEAEQREVNETLERRVQQEISERMRTEEVLRQSQKLEALGQLTGGLAHDFNNLLTIIRSSLYLLRDPGLPQDKQTRYLDAISETVERAAKLTGQLLAFARRQPLKPEVFDSGQHIHDAIDLLQTTVGTRVHIETSFTDTPFCIEADPNQFDTAVLNLALNARDAMGGKGTVRIGLHIVDTMPPLHGQPSRRGPFVALSISDTGCGIPPHHLERIFEPFFTTKEPGRGTGLGLSQVYGFVRQSGGDVQVESEVGRGTTFTLYLPKAKTTPRPREAPPEIAEPEEVGGGSRVLLVEDNRQVGESTAQLLERLGFVVTWREDAQTALDTLAQDGEIEMVLSDVVMPGGMNGLQLAREIERQRPDVPIVLMTGYSHALADGANPYPLLRKPFTAEEVAQQLGRTLRQHRARH